MAALDSKHATRDISTDSLRLRMVHGTQPGIAVFDLKSFVLSSASEFYKCLHLSLRKQFLNAPYTERFAQSRTIHLQKQFRPLSNALAISDENLRRAL